MIIYPAIDIQKGKVVRLIQGRFDESTEYARDPTEVAQQWESMGAQWLHVVDLDGAQQGSLQNFDAITRIVAAVKIPVQIGGGIRTRDDISRLLDAGIKRAILGTKVIEDRTFLSDVLKQWPHQIAVSLDCSNGVIQTKGWTATSDVTAIEFIHELKDQPLAAVVYTDIARDGMMTGPNYEALEQLLDQTGIPVIASGGISQLEDIKRLLTLKSRGLAGAITGKAIYEGKLDLKEALAACLQNG